MSCIALTDPHRRLLTTFTRGPRRVDDLDNRESLDELPRWGWVFGGERVELTGAGHYHAGTVVGGWSGGGWFFARSVGVSGRLVGKPSTIQAEPGMLGRR